MTTAIAYSPVKVAEVAFEVVRCWDDATRETGGPWPFGCCVETAVDLVEALDELAPDAGAVYVWGEFRVDRSDVCGGAPPPRRFAFWRGAGAVGELWVGHAWVELVDGTIVDPTAGQFRGGPPVAIVTAEDERRERWRAIKRGIE